MSNQEVAAPDSDSEVEIQKENVLMRPCVATGIPVPVFESDADAGDPIGQATVVGLNYLQNNPDIDWVKVCMISTPARKTWVMITSENKGQFQDSGSDYEFRHGAIFKTDTLKAREGEENVIVKGQIGEQVWLGGAKDAKVSRSDLEDDNVMAAYRSFREQVEGDLGSETSDLKME